VPDNIEQEIIDVIELFTDPEWVEMDAKNKIRVAFGEITEATASILRHMDPDERDEKLPRFITAAENVFDVYIEPLDLTGRPMIEGFVDRGLRAKIGEVITGAADWFD
jgi:hypothetical protein